MEARRGILNRGNIAQATGRGKRLTEDTLEAARKLAGDTQKDERVKQVLCLSCFYVLHSRMGGATITHRQCAGCDEIMTFSNTATDLLCKPCASENGLCCRCGADVELKERRKRYPFQGKSARGNL